jgi:hypothetical protein
MIPMAHPIVLFSSVILLFSVTPLRAEEAVRASLTELEAMALQQRWGEALLRMDDVPVGQRNDQWRKLVLRVVLGHLSQLESETSAGRDGVAVELGRRYPFLGRSEDFRRRRDDAVLAAYRDCRGLETTELDCVGRLSDRIREIGVEGDLVMRAATEISELESPAGAKRFLERQMTRLPASEVERLKKHPKLESLWREKK